MPVLDTQQDRGLQVGMDAGGHLLADCVHMCWWSRAGQGWVPSCYFRTPPGDPLALRQSVTEVTPLIRSINDGRFSLSIGVSLESSAI